MTFITRPELVSYSTAYGPGGETKKNGRVTYGGQFIFFYKNKYILTMLLSNQIN